MIPLIYVAGAMGAAYLFAKSRRSGVASNGAILTAAPGGGPGYVASATPPVPDNNAGKIGAAGSSFMPAGFTSTTRGPTQASPSRGGVATNPGGPSGLAQRTWGGSPMERMVYTRIGTTKTQVASSPTGRLVGQRPLLPPKPAQIVGGRNAQAPAVQSPRSAMRQPVMLPPGGRRR